MEKTGILNRATETRGTNAYYSAEEQARLAYMTVKTEIMANRASNGTYSAIEDATNLKNKVAADLTGTGWGTPTYDSTDKAIKVTYTNASIKSNGIADGKPANNGHVDFAIILSEKDATLSVDGVEVGSTTGGNEPSTEDFVFTVNGIEYTGLSTETWGDWIERKGKLFGFSIDSVQGGVLLQGDFVDVSDIDPEVPPVDIFWPLNGSASYATYINDLLPSSDPGAPLN